MTSMLHYIAALGAVERACLVARSVQNDLDRVRSITKDDRSPVTVADFAVQAVVSMALHEDDPHARIVGEEHAEQLREPDQAAVLESVVDAVRLVRPDADRSAVLEAIDRCDHDATAVSYWTLDPIDGTKGFLRGQQYAIALAKIDNGRVICGIMGCPNLPADQMRPLEQPDSDGAMYIARGGGGAYEAPAGKEDGFRMFSPVGGSGAFETPAGDGDAPTPRRIEASRFDGHRPVRVCESVEAEHSKHDDVVRIIEAIGGSKESVRIDSQCKYAVVARGQADAYLRMPTHKDYVERIWDHAAGSLIAIEAGAVVTDITGAPLEFTHGRRLEANRGIVCASAGVHGPIIGAIAELGLAATT
jgi:HAL2 family 3'(2'),5'-bisphosphate nucleotidase